MAFQAGSGRSSVVAAIACVLGLLTLTGCDQRPYPTPAQDPAPAPPPAELMGAPAPPSSDQTAPAEPVGNETAPAEAQSPAPPIAPPNATMAPIPNPEERVAPSTTSPPPTKAATPLSSDVKAPTTAGPALAGAPTASPVDRNAAIAALQAAGVKALNKGALLGLPPRFAIDESVQVSLTLPPGFGAAVRKAATENGLIEPDAPIDATAALSGAGYRIEPQEPQSQPLEAGKATEFHWTVTPTRSKRGHLRAEVCVAAPSGSAPICIGPVLAPKSGFHVNSQMLAIAAMILIVGLVVAWLNRGGHPIPSRSAAARRAAQDVVLNASENAP